MPKIHKYLIDGDSMDLQVIDYGANYWAGWGVTDRWAYLVGSVRSEPLKTQRNAQEVLLLSNNVPPETIAPLLVSDIRISDKQVWILVADTGVWKKQNSDTEEE